MEGHPEGMGRGREVAASDHIALLAPHPHRCGGMLPPRSSIRWGALGVASSLWLPTTSSTTTATGETLPPAPGLSSSPAFCSLTLNPPDPPDPVLPPGLPAPSLPLMALRSWEGWM